MANITIDMRMLNHSGIGTYLKNLIPLVVERSPEHTYYLLGEAKDIQACAWTGKQNIHIIHCAAPIFSIKEQLEIVGLIPRITDLFWCPHFNIPILYNGKMLVTVHDILHLARPELAGQWYKRLYAKVLLKQACQNSQQILTVSEFTKRELVDLLEVDPNKVEVVHLGVTPTWFAGKDSGGICTEPYFVYVGNVKAHKNLLGLVQAFTRICDEIPHKLIIVGKKEGFLTSDNTIERYAEVINDRILFTGYVDDYELQQYVANATAMVFPSFYEGFGLPPLEAMACSCPVIASNAASIPEVCQKAVLYVNPYDINDMASKMVLLAKDDQLRKALIVKGIEHARSFTWARSAEKTATIIQKVIEKA